VKIKGEFMDNEQVLHYVGKWDGQTYLKDLERGDRYKVPCPIHGENVHEDASILVAGEFLGPENRKRYSYVDGKRVLGNSYIPVFKVD
jgi:hypothetical protein